MLKTCSVCGKIHDFNKVCRRKTTKKATEANKFRKTYKWTEKSKYIKQKAQGGRNLRAGSAPFLFSEKEIFNHGK